jgi:hypothetical protein
MPQAVDGPAVSHTGRRLGGTADGLGRHGAPCRPRALDTEGIGRPAGGVGRGGHRQCSGCPDDAEKNALTPWRKQPWGMPPHAHAACVCAMEDVLEVDTRPYHLPRPVVCLDAASKPRVAEARTPLPGRPGPPARIAYEYARRGTAKVFMTFAPLAGQRRVPLTDGGPPWTLPNQPGQGRRAVSRRRRRGAGAGEPHHAQAGLVV